MTETPRTVEVNVVMGSQLRAIVRSALLHVRNKLTRPTQMSPLEIVDEELAKWPMSMSGEPDTLPEWLFYRFEGNAVKSDGGTAWQLLHEADKLFWEHEAAAVRRAVGRGGFKRDGTRPPEVMWADPQVQIRHQSLFDLLQKYKEANQPMISVDQIRDILVGRSLPDQYDSALQTMPEGVDK